MKSDFVTIDFETTGLVPSRNRVIEIGIVRTSPSGKIIAEYSSLINPGRDVGRTDIHGITAGMLESAPTFSELSGDIAHILNGAIIVAHNARFDTRFLASEFAREGRVHDQFDALCTLELMYSGYPRGPRKLGECCRFIGIEIRDAHCAFDDAQMASELLHHLLLKVSPSVLPDVAKISVNPPAVRESVPRNSAINPRKNESSYLSDLMRQLPDDGLIGVSSAVSAAQYLNLLDRILEDRKIDQAEAQELFAFADDVALTTERVAGLNAAYMANLCTLAISDGEVTAAERVDLATVAILLNIDDWEPLFAAPLSNAVTRAGSQLIPGMSVCFTGEMSLSRSELTSKANSCGLDVKSNVTKSLDVLVVADTDSPSSKARKAREFGIRIIHESVFVRMMDDVGA